MLLHDDVADWSQLFTHQSKICFVIGRSSYFIPFQLVEFRSMSIRLAPEIGIHLPVEPPNPERAFRVYSFFAPNLVPSSHRPTSEGTRGLWWSLIHWSFSTGIVGVSMFHGMD